MHVGLQRACKLTLMKTTLLNFHKDAGNSNIIANILYTHTHTHTHAALREEAVSIGKDSHSSGESTLSKLPTRNTMSGTVQTACVGTYM